VDWHGSSERLTSGSTKRRQVVRHALETASFAQRTTRPKRRNLHAKGGHSEPLPEARCLLRTHVACNFNYLDGVLAINQLIKSLNRNVFVGRMQRVEIYRGSQEQIEDSDL